MKIEDCKGVAHLEELGFVVVYEATAASWSDDHPCSMDFAIWLDADYQELLDEGVALAPGATLKGSIKWDGCSNWIEPSGNYFHLCGNRQLVGLMNAMAACYHIAGKFMPEANE